MSHYYTEKPKTASNERMLRYTFKGKSFKFKSDHSIFSKNHIDEATNLLIQTLYVEPNRKKALDLGCGYGIIGTVLASYYEMDVTLSDVNERALHLAKQNLAFNQAKGNVIKSNGFESIDQTFDLIVTNPPIRIGKKPLYDIFKQAYQHLNDDGTLWLVMHKKHGALSALKHFKMFSDPKVVLKKSGFHIISVKKH